VSPFGVFSSQKTSGQSNAETFNAAETRHQALQVVKRRGEDIDSQLVTETNEAKQVA